MNNKETLQSYNTRLGVNNDTLDSILEQINTLPSGRSNNNIFIQEDEPENKTGLWVKTDKDIKDVSILNLILTLTWNSLTTMEYPVTYPRVVKLGEYLYIFGGRDSSGVATARAYKYHIPTNTFTRLTDMPEAKRGAAIGIVGTNVYIFGGQTSNSFSKKSYKYDTLLDSYTQITDYPQVCSDMSFGTVGTDIYMFGGTKTASSSNVLTYAYKYDTLTNSYTTLTSFPQGFRVGASCTVGKKIYFFCGFTSNDNAVTTIRSYDTSTNSYTTLGTMPIECGHNCCEAIGDDVYIFGGFKSSSVTYSSIYKYNITDGSIVKYDDAPNNTIYNAGCCSDNVNIYVVGGQIPGGIRNEIARYGNTDASDYDVDTVIISTKEGANKVQLNDTTTVMTSNVYIYNVSDGLKELAEAYIGDGNKWEKIN